MTISEKLDQIIQNDGGGSVRDALNVMVARLEQKEAEAITLRSKIDELEAEHSSLCERNLQLEGFYNHAGGDHYFFPR